MSLPTLGSRGQGWVIGQFILAGVVVVTAGAGPSWAISRPLAGAVIVFGGLFGAWSLLALGNSLTPYPAPRADGELVERGPYRIVRHPIYTSLLIMLFGVCLWGSWWGLVPLTVLLVWWLGKAQVEEAFLRTAYPGYEQYCQRVRKRLIPWIL